MKISAKFSGIALKARTEYGYIHGKVSKAAATATRWYQKTKSDASSHRFRFAAFVRRILLLHINVEELREEAEFVVPVPSLRRKSAIR